MAPVVVPLPLLHQHGRGDTWEQAPGWRCAKPGFWEEVFGEGVTGNLALSAGLSRLARSACSLSRYGAALLHHQALVPGLVNDFGLGGDLELAVDAADKGALGGCGCGCGCGPQRGPGAGCNCVRRWPGAPTAACRLRYRHRRPSGPRCGCRHRSPFNFILVATSERLGASPARLRPARVRVALKSRVPRFPARAARLSRYQSKAVAVPAHKRARVRQCALAAAGPTA